MGPHHYVVTRDDNRTLFIKRSTDRHTNRKGCKEVNNQQCFPPRNPHPQGLAGSHLSLCFFFLKYFALNCVRCNVYLKFHPGVYNFCFSSSSSLNSLAVSKLVLVCMGTNLVTHPQSVDGLFIPYNCLDYVK